MITEVEISLQARSKIDRYYGASAIRERLDSLDGSLFRDEDDVFYLRTIKRSHRGPPRRVVIIFRLTSTTAHVITQTTDHYDWQEIQPVQNPPFAIELNGDHD